MKNTYVLDTNVLLNNPNIIYSFQKNDIVIPYKVIEELDRHKTSEGLKGLSARDCSRTLNTLLKNSKESLKDGIKLDNGGKLYIKSHRDFNLPNIEETTADDCIIKVAVGVSEQTKRVIVVSNDVLVRVKANAFGLDVIGYDSNVELESVKDLYKGYKEIPVPMEVIEVFYQNRDKETVFPMNPEEITDKKLNPNDFVILTSKKLDITKKPYPILKYDGKNNQLLFVKEKKLSAGKVKAMNIEQTMAIDLLMDPNVSLVTLTGIAGSGKTLATLAAALDQIMEKRIYKNLVVIRPIEPVGKDIGYLPGSKEEKMEPWLGPVKDNLRFILSDNSENSRKSKSVDFNMQLLLEEGTIEMEAMTYIRGRSINNAFILIDECQNISVHEIKTILTRVGKGTKIVLTGDVEQIDRRDVDTVSNGLSVVIEKFKSYELAGHVTMIEGVRSELSALAAKIL